MNNIYVETMPSACDECPCCNNDVDYGACCNLGAYDYAECHQTIYKHPNCPLKPLIAHDKLKDLDYEILKRDYDFLRKEYNRLIDVGNHRLAEERKKVVQEIRDYMENHSHIVPVLSKKRNVIYKIGLTRFLDQIKRGK